jgi:hypothetical protein
MLVVPFTTYMSLSDWLLHAATSTVAANNPKAMACFMTMSFLGG